MLVRERTVLVRERTVLVRERTALVRELVQWYVNVQRCLMNHTRDDRRDVNAESLSSLSVCQTVPLSLSTSSSVQSASRSGVHRHSDVYHGALRPHPTTMLHTWHLMSLCEDSINSSRTTCH